MATVFFYPHIFTGSVVRRILLVVPVDTLYRTSIISFSTVLPMNLFVNLSLAPLSLFLTHGPDLGVWPGVSAEFLRTPIPRKGSGSTTTTTTTPHENLRVPRLRLQTPTLQHWFKVHYGSLHEQSFYQLEKINSNTYPKL